MVDGVIVARGDLQTARDHPTHPVVDLRDGVLLPGFVDTHVHYPQVRAIGALGMPLLEWLEQCALPEECRLADVDYAREVAAEFCFGLVSAGTTSALVFGSHFAAAVDILFRGRPVGPAGHQRARGRATGSLREDLLTTARRAFDERLDLADRWHGVGRTGTRSRRGSRSRAATPILEACSACSTRCPMRCSRLT